MGSQWISAQEYVGRVDKAQGADEYAARRFGGKGARCTAEDLRFLELVEGIVGDGETSPLRSQTYETSVPVCDSHRWWLPDPEETYGLATDSDCVGCLSGSWTGSKCGPGCDECAGIVVRGIRVSLLKRKRSKASQAKDLI